MLKLYCRVNWFHVLCKTFRSCFTFSLYVFPRSGPSFCAQSLYHQCRSTRDRPLCSWTSSSSYTWCVLIWTLSFFMLIFYSEETHRHTHLSHLTCGLYDCVSRTGSDASPVLWCDPLGGLPSQPLPAAGGCSQQLGQSAGGKPGPAEPTAGQLAARQKSGMLMGTGSRCFCQCTT